jgi:hypothetical protein
MQGRRVTARFASGGADAFLGADLLRTRCPGPLLTDLADDTPLAAGRLPLRALGRRRVTLHLNRGAQELAPNYRLRSRPDLTLVLEREEVERRVINFLTRR